MLSKPPLNNPEIPSSRRGFALALLTRAKNPSRMVRTLYLSHDKVPHACLSGATAEAIGAAHGEELVDPSYFFTERRWREHRSGLGLPETPFPPGQTPSKSPIEPALDQLPTGTVGAVCLDSNGCIATVTSTGGLTNKFVGRLGAYKIVF